MKNNLIFIGNKFLHNTSLQYYIIREVKKHISEIDSILFYQENDNSLFLNLETQLNNQANLFIATTKQNFSTIGKLLCTVTGDNQVLQGSTLIPRKSKKFEDGSYLIEHNNSLINVFHIDEMQKIPPLFIEQKPNLKIHILEETSQTLNALLTPLAQTYEVAFELTTIIEGWIEITLIQKKHGNLDKFLLALEKLLPNKIIQTNNIVRYIIDKLSSTNQKITFAESCTGGLLTYYFTKENGASTILDGSLITYSNDLKETWIAVEQKALEAFGAVSVEVVRQMSEGALNVSHADFAISISGIAGDGGGSAEKPVGTVFIGVRNKQNHIEKRFLFKGDRNYVQEQSVLMALKMVLLLDKKTFFEKI